MAHRPERSLPDLTLRRGALNLVDGKWKVVILYKLPRGTLRLNEIRRLIPAVTPCPLAAEAASG